MGRYAPTIDATGCNGPDFATVLANLTADYLAIFGDDAVLTPDVQDGQLVGVFAKGLSDASNAVVAAFNSFSPSKAQGNGLSSVVKINGLQRKIPTLSIVSLTLVGQAGITITNGQAFDGVNTWALPTTVTIPNSGTITVQAVCTTLGAITAAINTITQIKTPIFGWQTVTNAAQAIPGTPVETDAALRVRQSQSTSLPSQTIFEGIVASLQAINGVTRVRGYENNTGSTDGNGIPTKTLAFFVEGGANQDIWNAIARKITPAIPTQGAQSTTVIDASGSTRLVKFDRPTVATINVIISVKQLNGYSSATVPAALQDGAAAFLAAWPIGGDGLQQLSWSELMRDCYLAAVSVATTFKIVSIQLQKNAGSVVTNTDIALAYNESTVAGTITVTPV